MPSSPPASLGLVRSYACPLQKAYPDHFPDCSQKLREVRRVKEHLYRYHKRVHCYRCHTIFRKQQDLNQHMTSVDRCESAGTQPPLVTCGISNEMEGKLRRRTQQGSDEVKKWLSIWHTLFPGAEPPPTPYNDGPDQCNSTLLINKFTDFLSSQLPDIMRSALRHEAQRTATDQPTQSPAHVQVAIDKVLDDVHELARSFIMQQQSPAEPKPDSTSPESSIETTVTGPPRISTPYRERWEEVVHVATSAPDHGFTYAMDPQLLTSPHLLPAFQTTRVVSPSLCFDRDATLWDLPPHGVVDDMSNTGFVSRGWPDDVLQP